MNWRVLLRLHRWQYHLYVFLLIVVTVTLGRSVGTAPALGPLLSPFTGFWQNKPLHLIKKNETFDWPQLQSPVTVSWDEFGIPHIFAAHDADLFFVQGYIQARDRLFQMDMTSRAGSGRLSEVIGDRTMPVDIFYVKVGMRQAVERVYQSILGDAETRLAAESYSAGVNHYVENLKKADWPVEYKLLGARPRLWDVKDIAAVYMVMNFRLSGRTYDLWLAQHIQKFGYEKIRKIFPEVMPDEYGEPYPKGQNTLPQRQGVPATSGFDRIPKFQNWPSERYIQPFATNGSNNWAVASTKTEDGHTYLANDTHLKFHLPAIWYEQQLKSPSMNVYGASIAGTPGLQIGFHKQFGWGVTNGTPDILDWYEIEIDEKNPKKYKFLDQWLEMTTTTEAITSKSGQSTQIELDETRSGLVYSREAQLALTFRWLGATPGNELKTFLNLSRAKNRTDCQKAMVHYVAPVQNLICADTEGVSMHHMGKAPKRLNPGGAYIQDGSKPDPTWETLVGIEELPKTEDPLAGFVYSANQLVHDSRYRYYLSWDYDESYRAKRIRSYLENLGGQTDIIGMKSLQTDDQNLHAGDILPAMISAVSDQPDLSAPQQQLLKSLSEWNFHMRADQWEPSFFDAWWKLFEESLYAQELGPKLKNAYPRIQHTVKLIQQGLEGHSDRELYWFLDLKDFEPITSHIESLMLMSFQAAWKQLSDRYGADPRNWSWSQVQKTSVPHLLNLKGFGRFDLLKHGSRYTVDVNNGENGAVWRQIVKIGPNFEAHTNFPGGTSGNPFSPQYDAFVDGWAKGEYRKIHFLEEPMSFQLEDK